MDLTLMPRMILMKASRNDLILTQLYWFCSRLCVCFGQSLSRVNSRHIFEFVLSDVLGLINFLFFGMGILD